MIHMLSVMASLSLCSGRTGSGPLELAVSSGRRTPTRMRSKEGVLMEERLIVIHWGFSAVESHIGFGLDFCECHLGDHLLSLLFALTIFPRICCYAAFEYLLISCSIDSISIRIVVNSSITLLVWFIS